MKANLIAPPSEPAVKAPETYPCLKTGHHSAHWRDEDFVRLPANETIQLSN